MNTVNRHISSLIGYALMATQIGFDIKNEKKKQEKKKERRNYTSCTQQHVTKSAQTESTLSLTRKNVITMTFSENA